MQQIHSSQMALDIPLRKTNTEQEALSLFWTENYNIENVKTMASFIRAVKREILSKLFR